MKASTLPTDPWNTKLNVKKLPKRVRLDKDFAGIKAGSILYVGTPQLIDEYVRKIPYGEVRTIVRLRNELARKNKCDATCPVSTAIFLRISAQAAIEKIKSGVSVDEVSPFWRVIESGSTIAGKIDIDGQWIDHQREIEAASMKLKKS
jgi:6-O-methylguanine DNA methyltransferase, DNA binding domain